MNIKQITMYFLIILFFNACIGKKSDNEVKISKSDSVKEGFNNEFVLNKALFLNNYSDKQGFMPNKGLVPTAEVAFKIGEIILSEIYGKENIEEQKPFSINLENGIWIIEGSIDKEYLGGVAYIEIKKVMGKF